jgi:hypothetical protein
MLVKTPLATLIAAMVTSWIALRGVFKGRFKNHQLLWTTLCLGIPVVIFLASAMSSRLNIGIRHVLGLYPFAFVAIGCTAAWLWRSRGKKTRIAIVALGVMLAAESLSVYPNFIPFFNVIAANAPGGKIQLLGDSNLDWGQDLPLLAAWQRGHPDQTLYLSYFGYADPAYYGIKYRSLPGGYYYDEHRAFPDPYSRCVIAISASNLQGILVDPKLLDFYAQWRHRKPLAVLGDSIYLFEYPEGINDER